MAQHFAVSSDTHSLYSDGIANNRSKEYQNNYDKHLSEQIKIILIERVDLSLAATTKEKRVLIEVREGYWQTQLRTLSRYGGLNKKDERIITNKRLATTRAATVPPAEPQRRDSTPAPAGPPTVDPPAPELRRSSRTRKVRSSYI